MGDILSASVECLLAFFRVFPVETVWPGLFFSVYAFFVHPPDQGEPGRTGKPFNDRTRYRKNSKEIPFRRGVCSLRLSAVARIASFFLTVPFPL